jgi:transcriptional regulator with XRE-family HTH domain
MVRLGPMDDQMVGAALRSIRIRRRWRQDDLSARAGVSRTIIGRIEHGRLDSVPLGLIRKVAAALDARFDAVVRWQGGDLGRLINARHAAMHEAMARFMAGLDGWVVEPEVSFSIYGERGIIDVLAWHPARRILLVIELKTELVDVNEIMGSADRRRRLAATIAHDRGWDPLVVATWVVLAEGRTNRRAIAAHQAVLRTKFPTDGRAMRRWLREPTGGVDALGFMPSVHGVRTRRDVTAVRRVARPRTRPDRARADSTRSGEDVREGAKQPRTVANAHVMDR